MKIIFLAITVVLCVIVPPAANAQGQEAFALLDERWARLEHVSELLRAADKAGTPVDYERSAFLVAQMFVPYGREDVHNGREERALQVAREVRDLLTYVETSLAEKRHRRPVPRVDISKIEIRDGLFFAPCTLDDRIEERPVFLTGYGHFSQVVKDLPLLARMGINVIQIEIGPTHVVVSENEISTAQITGRILPALDRAAASGVGIALLLSPHYFPDWAMKQWPELANKGGGFLHYSIHAPQARRIIETYLRTIIPLIRDHPALQSLCLTNEPIYTDPGGDPWLLEQWPSYLRQVHGTIKKLNRVYRTDFESFDEVPFPQLKFGPKADRALLYDATVFNQETFAEWHRWMADIVHSMAPDIPVHAKVMNPIDVRTVFRGTDPALFANFSQINGNDCAFLYNFGEDEWVSRWLEQNMYLDIQRSMRLLPVFDTEHHIIRDRQQRVVPPEHVYTALWQGAVHGQGGSTIWVWERTYDGKSDFEGSIMHRPACAAAVGRCALDLMRLSREVAALQSVRPEVALPFSTASYLRGKSHERSLFAAYTALNFCGIPVGFVTDRQMAHGDLSRYRTIILPEKTATTPEAIRGLAQFVRDGGRVVALGDHCLAEDHYGRAVGNRERRAAITTTLGTPREALSLRSLILKELRDAGTSSPVTLRDSNGRLAWGVEWRSTKRDGKTLVNMVNLTCDPVTVRIQPASHFSDAISERPLGGMVTLEPLKPVLAVER